MDKPDAPSRRMSEACPSCGASAGGAYARFGVCLHCASQRFLALESADFTGVGPSELPASPGAAASSDTLPEHIGPYDIIEEIGRGGMGRVLVARHTGMGRIVALKVISESAGAIPGLELRFLREISTAAQLKHPHIVAVHDSGRADGFLYLSMDYIEGGDLAQRLRAHTFTPVEATRLVRRLAEALAYAHANGVLHRDLKPSNILVEGDEPLIADFGLAAQLESGGDLTLRTGVLGTPHYLAPEAMQRGSAALSVASDLYALGVILFELLTGRTPFAGASPAELALLCSGTDAPSPRALSPAVSRDLETVCLKCLERDPGKRYASAAALAEDLQRCLDGMPIKARPISAAERAWRWCRRKPAAASALALLCLVTLGSTLAAMRIATERERAERAFREAQSSEQVARERLREARLSEARALRRTGLPGRRTRALNSLAEAARIRPGLDLRNEAIAALMQVDVAPADTWDLHVDKPAQLTVSPDGTHVALEWRDVADLDHSPALLHTWKNPTPVLTLDAPGSRAVGSWRFSPDGSLALVRYADETFRIWKVADGSLLRLIEQRPLPGDRMLTQDFNTDYDISADNTQFALGLPEHGLGLYRISDGTELARWDRGIRINAVRFSPDGRRIAVLRNRDHVSPHVWILNATTLALEYDLSQSATPQTAEWSADGARLFVGTEDNALASFDARTGNLETRLALGSTDILMMRALGNQGLVVVRGADTHAHVVNLALGREELLVGGLGPSGIDGGLEGDWFSASSMTNTVTRWEVTRPCGFTSVPPPAPSALAGTTPTGGLDISPDGKWIVTGHGRFVVIRYLQTGRVLTLLDSGSGNPLEDTCVAFEPDGSHILVSSSLSGLKRLELKREVDGGVAAVNPAVLDPAPGYVIASLSADRRTAVSLSYGTGDVRVLELGATGARLVSHWTTPGVYSAALSPDLSQVLVNATNQGPEGDSNRLRIHEALTGRIVRELPAKPSCDAAWSRAGNVAMTSNGAARSTLWNTLTWEPMHTLEGDLGGDVTSFALSQDGRLAVIAQEEHLHLVSTATGEKLATFECPGASGLASSLCFLPDRKQIAVLWLNGRVDVIDPEAIHRALEPLGLAW